MDGLPASSMIAFLLGCLFILTASCCVAALLRVDGTVAFCLASGLTAFAEVVVVSLAVSVFDAYQRDWFVSALGGVAGAALVAVAIVRPPRPRPRFRHAINELVGDPVLVVLGAAVAIELVYLLALAVFTPPTEYDVLTYHLVRVAFWLERGSIGFVPDASYRPIDEFPPGAEILQSATLLLSDSIRLVGLVQLAALCATVLGIYGVAARIGFPRRAAAFGALLFPLLPVVAMQAPTALNDLVVAALVTSASYFMLGSTRRDAALSGLAIALLVATKVTAALALPVLAAIAIVGCRGRRVRVLTAGIVGAALGSAWYIANLTRPDNTGGTAGHTIGAEDGLIGVVARTSRYLIQTVELPGGNGRNAYLYIVAAAIVGVVAAATMGWRSGLVASALTAVVVFTVDVESVLHRAYYSGWELLGYDEANEWGIIREPTAASNLQSWFGPVAVVLTIASSVVLGRSVIRRERRPLPLLLASSPLVLVVGTAIVTAYHPFSGRFVMGGVALSAATWGVTRAWTPGAIAVVAVATTTAALSVTAFSERPAGIDLLEANTGPSIWTLPRPWAQSIQPEIARMIDFIDRRAEDGSTVALTRNPVIYPFAFAGYPRIEHPLVYADSRREAARRGAGWAVLPLSARCVAGWRAELRSPPWAVYRQVPGAGCR